MDSINKGDTILIHERKGNGEPNLKWGWGGIIVCDVKEGGLAVSGRFLPYKEYVFIKMK